MPNAPAATPGGWFVRAATREDARARVYVFPHVGGGPGSVASLAEAFPETVEPWALNLPGRQARFEEPPRTDLEPLVAELAADLASAGGPPYRAFLGYCGGALLAYLTARLSPPDRLCVGSFAAPDVALVPRRLHLLPGELFWDVVLAQGGVPPELTRQELRPVFESAIRADFALCASYFHRRTEPLAVPITVLRGSHDDELSRGSVLGWRRHSTAGLDVRELDTGHWLVDEAPARVAQCVAECVSADLLAGAPR